MRGKAEGIVCATKPLSYQGQLIESFWIRFHEGKAVEWHAEKNNELLTKLITMDEGSAYLGECALVPYDSPWSAGERRASCARFRPFGGASGKPRCRTAP